jgi:CBS domain-containing protein
MPTVTDIIERDPVTVQPEHRHDRLPVLEHGRLVGVVTRLDVLEAIVSAG